MFKCSRTSTIVGKPASSSYLHRLHAKMENDLKKMSANKCKNKEIIVKCRDGNAKEHCAVPMIGRVV